MQDGSLFNSGRPFIVDCLFGIFSGPFNKAFIFLALNNKAQQQFRSKRADFFYQCAGPLFFAFA
jgi:hypothetical protein